MYSVMEETLSKEMKIYRYVKKIEKKF